MRIRRSPGEGGSQAPAQPKSDRPPAPPPAGETAPDRKDHPATQPALPDGPPGETGVLRQPGVPPRDVPLMSIRKDEPGQRVEVGPVTPGVGVPDVLIGSIGIVAVAVIGSLLLGALLGGVLVLLKHRLGWGGPEKDAEDHITLTER
jgi:hypothetical protein